MKKGRIIKSLGALYIVVDEFMIRHEMKALGILRYQNEKPKVGDMVMFDDFSIVKLLERENDLVRPSICNIDQALLITSAKAPEFSFNLLDKFLLLIVASNIKPVIVVSKMDLLKTDETIILRQKLAYYHRFFPVLYFSTKTKEGLQDIVEITSGKVNVLAGQTGAGKSSLLNTLNPELHLATDEISKALGRGKHTTRHVELIQFQAGWIADTPGFSKLDFTGLEADTFGQFYPDFFALSHDCRFNGCTHTHEPGCKVKLAYESQEILPERYENYLHFYEEIKAIKPRY